MQMCRKAGRSSTFVTARDPAGLVNDCAEACDVLRKVLRSRADFEPNWPQFFSHTHDGWT